MFYYILQDLGVLLTQLFQNTPLYCWIDRRGGGESKTAAEHTAWVVLDLGLSQVITETSRGNQREKITTLHDPPERNVLQRIMLKYIHTHM